MYDISHEKWKIYLKEATTRDTQSSSESKHLKTLFEFFFLLSFHIFSSARIHSHIGELMRPYGHYGQWEPPSEKNG